MNNLRLQARAIGDVMIPLSMFVDIREPYPHGYSSPMPTLTHPLCIYTGL